MSERDELRESLEFTERELREAKAEIARLTEKCVFLGDANMELLDRSKAADIRTEKAEAEIARLRTAFEKYLKVTRPLLDDTKAWAEARAALEAKSDD